MNILPLVLALALMLSILTVEKLEKFKNQSIIQREYQIFLQQNDREVFNRRQESLFGYSQKTLRQLTFRFFLDKAARDRNENITKQYHMLTIELMKIVYGKAAFFKNLEKKRPHFLEDMLNAIQVASEAAPEKTIKRIQDIARLNLDDPELQEAFYHMLKGTISRKELNDMKTDDKNFDFTSIEDRTYVSLFNFINYNGKEKRKGLDLSTPKIMVQRAPREILKAIFIEDEIVDKIITRRNELAKSKDKERAEKDFKKEGAEKDFKNEFNEYRRPGLDDTLLDFSISSPNKDAYN